MGHIRQSVIIDTDKVMEATDQRYADNLDTGSQVISFDQQYDYVWTNMKNDARCEILDEKLFGKVCKWSEKPVPYQIICVVCHGAEGLIICFVSLVHNTAQNCFISKPKLKV